MNHGQMELRAMLTIAYCRVSTEEQAAEGFSINGQAEKLRAYAELHDLGRVTVIDDPGLSGKNLDRPGLQRVLTMVAEGHVTNVLVWRLDRLSRDLGDLILLADTFGQAGVAMHSFTEKLDLSSATGRIFYNILGSFAQFYREQLAENVRMGMHQAARQGKWINRPKTGYDLVDGDLVPNEMAPTVRRIFRMRAEGANYHEIERQTGVKYSTARAIALSRIYLGEVVLNGEWFAGQHSPIITEEEFHAAHRGHVPGKGRRQGSDVMWGRVRCGLCGRVAGIDGNGEGRVMYRCRHRGNGCAQPRRTASGLSRAALLGLRLIAGDSNLQGAIRSHLEAARQKVRQDRSRVAPEAAGTVEEVSERRRKLLELHYRDQISADLFAEEERRLGLLLASALADQETSQRTDLVEDDAFQHFAELVGGTPRARHRPNVGSRHLRGAQGPRRGARRGRQHLPGPS
jgi:DNA invertase Pin-like site-specific DNA recombinase